MSTETNSYFPNLQCKRSEFRALEHLDFSMPWNMVPIVHFKAGKIGRDKLGERARNLVKWCELGAGGPIATVVDVDDWSNAREAFLGLDRSLEVWPGFHASFLQSLRHEIDEVADHFDTTTIACLPVAAMDDRLLLRELKGYVSNRSCQVVVDLGYWERSPAELGALATRWVEIANENDLGKIALAIGSYPLNNAEISQQAVTQIERVEWSLYSRTENAPPYQFSDFGPVCAVDGPSGGQSVKVAPAIRYTHSEGFEVYRGKYDDWSKYQTTLKRLATSLVESDVYFGEDFSWGDERFTEISQMSTADVPRGHAAVRAEEWNHHLAAVARDVASPGARQRSPATPPIAG